VAYEILSDDLYDRDRRREFVGPRRFRRRIPRAFYIHLFLALLFILIIILIFTSDINFNLGGDSRNLDITGELRNFNEYIEGDVKIYSKNFMLETTSGSFDFIDKDIVIENFTGNISYNRNLDIIEIRGKANKFEFENNVINLNSDEFYLNSSEKISIDFNLDSLNLEFVRGRAKFSNDFTFDLFNSSVELGAGNITLSFDGLFSILVVPKNFTIINEDKNLRLDYMP
jgi:hypothetical protein